MPRLNFAQEQALIAQGRGLQAQAIRDAFSVLFHLPARLTDAVTRRAASRNSPAPHITQG